VTGDGVPPIHDWNRQLGGRVAVITGGGAGFGAGIARLFAAHARVDVLVNNVGDYRPLVPFHESTPASWQHRHGAFG
jgi:3-oxoacyl-[acyl-carrier protein] reductase